MHGGTDHITYKPNHLSVMSYAYQTDGIPITVPGRGLFYLFDFSSFVAPNLNENSLNENAGMGPRMIYHGTKYGARWWIGYTGRKGVETFDASSAVDWNKDGRINSGVRFNLNLGYDTTYSTLKGGVNEWARLYCRGGEIGKGGGLHSQSLLPSEFLYPCLKASERPLVPLSTTQNIQRIARNEQEIASHCKTN
jgi:hypothetical protein